MKFFKSIILYFFRIEMQFNKSILLLRGLPGSGKSSLAQVLSEDGVHPIFSVDDYFTDAETGEYEFRFQDNHVAYKQCEANCRLAAERGTSKIIIHNTFTLDWEVEPYFAIAKEFSYAIFILTVENYHGSKNIHQIADEQIQRMALKYKVKLY